MTEKAWQAQVLQLATLYRWLAYHPFDSRHSTAGYPDLTLVRPPSLVFAELKTAKGRLAPAQMVWLEQLRAAGQEAYVWRPDDFEAVQARLRLAA